MMSIFLVRSTETGMARQDVPASRSHDGEDDPIIPRHPMKTIAPSARKSNSSKKSRARLAGLAALFTFIGTPAWAYDWAIFGAHVVHMEGTYMPTVVPFNVDKPGGNCGAGATLQYTGHGADTPTAQANTKAIYALLLAARLTNTPVDLYGNNSDCSVSFVHLD